MSRKHTVSLDNVLADIETLKKGCSLLEQLWMAFGPYGIGEALRALEKEGRLDQRVSANLSTQIQDYFGYDDSE